MARKMAKAKKAAKAGKRAGGKVDRSKLPLPTPPFEGVVGKTYLDSTED